MKKTTWNNILLELAKYRNISIYDETADETYNAIALVGKVVVIGDDYVIPRSVKFSCDAEITLEDDADSLCFMVNDSKDKMHRFYIQALVKPEVYSSTYEN